MSDKSAGARVGGYEVLAKLGQGGMGAVFKARQISVDRIVALKVLPPRFSKNERYVKRFLREARAAARLNHPNIVQAIDAGFADGYHYFAMEFIDGRDLRSILEERDPLPESEALAIAAGIARALDAAHRAGIIHRDVKPDNVLIGPDGVPKLADLGLARHRVRQEAGVTQAGRALGTPDYISPEQVRGLEDIDGRADLYSLGASLFRLLSGEKPFSGGTVEEVMIKHLHEIPPDLRTLKPDLSDATVTIVRKAMAKDRDRRYQSAAEMSEDIEHALAGEPLVHAAAEPAAAPATATSLARSHAAARRAGRSARAGSKRMIGIAAAALLIVIGAVIGIAAMQGDGDRAGNAIDVSPPPAAPTEPAAPAGTDPGLEPLRAARAWVLQHPKDYAGGLARYAAALGAIREPGLRAAAERERDEVIRHRDADAAVEKLRRDATQRAKAGDLDGAIALCRDLPPRLADLMREPASTIIAQIHDRARSRIDGILAEARELGRQAKLDDALARLDDLSRVRYEPRARQIADLRRRLEHERKRLAAQETPKPGSDVPLAALTGLFDRIAEHVANDEPAAAARAAANAKAKPGREKDERLAELAAAADLLADQPARKLAVLTAFLKSREGSEVGLATEDGPRSGSVHAVGDDRIVLHKTFQINRETKFREITVPVDRIRLDDALARYELDWLPDGSAGVLVRAVCAYAEQDAAAMTKSLRQLDGHWLHGHYASKLADVKNPLGRPTVYAAWPFDAAEASRRQRETALAVNHPLHRIVPLRGATAVRMMLIPAGEFVMGSPAGEPGRGKDETQRRVRISRPFYCAVTELSQGQWRAIARDNPSDRVDGALPVEQVSWQDCQAFLRQLREQTGIPFRLPTEAEWEYACRAGRPTAFHTGERTGRDDARFESGDEEHKRPRPFGVGSANAFGLINLHGNIAEWCADWYGDYGAADGVVVDPAGADAGTERVVRGGSWRDGSAAGRSAARASRKPGRRDARVGLRLVADVEPRRAPEPLARIRTLLHGDVYSFDPDTMRIELFYDFRDPAQARDWSRTLRLEQNRHRGEKVQVRDGRLYFAKTRLKAITQAQFTAVDVSLDFRVTGGTNAATVVVCADGKGTHYELCGNWYDPHKEKWICQLFTYRKGKAPLNQLGRKWPQRPSPFGEDPEGRLGLRFSNGWLFGRVVRGEREVRLVAEDHELKSGSVGVWAYEAREGWFDNIAIDGRIDLAWLETAAEEAGLRGKPERPQAPPEARESPEPQAVHEPDRAPDVDEARAAVKRAKRAARKARRRERAARRAEKRARREAKEPGKHDPRERRKKD
jgi:serine/threonine-protein kinase